MIYLTSDRDETRAVTHPMTAAIERLLRWVLFGSRQHENDLRLSLGALPRFARSETKHEGVQR